MRPALLADENILPATIRWLRSTGFRVTSVKGLGLGGAPDEFVYELARKRRETLITMDVGFSQLRLASRHPLQVVLIRPGGRNAAYVQRILAPFLAAVDLASPALRHAMIVVESSGHRVRTLDRGIAFWYQSAARRRRQWHSAVRRTGSPRG